MLDFVHLHVHSDYSLTDAAVSVMALADRAEALGMTHLALTDHGNMFGIMEFIAACKETVNGKGQHEERKNPVIPIVGCEVYVSPGSRFDKKGAEHENKYHHLVLLARNRQGYLNLVQLCSRAYTEGFYYRPRIDEELLERYHEGLIALSACVSGEIPRLIQAGKTGEAEEKARRYRDLFGKDEEGEPCFYLELQDHGIPSGGLRGTDLSQRDICHALVAISKKIGVPLAATNDVHYLSKNDNVAHDILLCIGTGKVRTDERRKKYHGDQFYFKTAEEMEALFREYPEAVANTARIAKRCAADVPKVKVEELAKYLPDFEIPEGFDSMNAFLRHQTLEGLAKRYAKEKAQGGSAWEEIQKRAEYELDTIINMGFAGYFLIVADFINYAKDHGIPVGPGRGSGAGSIIAYSLRITDVDPLKYNLLFERFLNSERVSMPDFDVDFANEGRDEVIRYVTEKYRQERVGQIITFGTLGARQVIKDVARVLGISIPESDMITKLIPKDLNITLKAAMEKEPKLYELEQDPRYAELFELAGKLEGLHRHSSIHAAGIVIGKSPLIELIPLYQERDDPKTGKPGGIATQYSMNYLEPCGLVKMDFLGLKTLDVIKHTEELIRRKGGAYAAFKVEDAPEDDEAAFKMLGEGKSFAIFQFESDGMQNILKQTKPNSIEDLSALNAMYRPGPMQNIPQFVESKNGRQKISYPDPSLEKALKETYGVIVYQEQVMQVARIIAGYSLRQADVLRRAMGKKKKEVFEKEKVPFLKGAEKQGYSAAKAGEIYDMLVLFAGYGFNKSHAVAYSVIAYHTAYLKANFPAEFMAANLTNEIHSADKNKLSECISEARRMGIAIDPPDVNNSDSLFTVVDGRIMYGFLGIKGLGQAAAEEIVRGRKESPYKSFIDFLDRVDVKTVGKKAVELLVKTGAFDRFGVSRETLAGNLESAVEYARKKKEDEDAGQTNLFEDSSGQEASSFKYEEFPAMSREDRLNLEKQLIGFYFSGHPMDEYRDVWEKSVKVDLGQTKDLKTGNCILVGIIKSVKTISTGKGKMAFALLEDYNGEIEVVFYAAAWEKCMNLVEPDKVAALQGKITYQKDKDRYSFIAESFVNIKSIDTAVKETEEMERKWETYRNTWAYMADLKSGSILNALKGSYTAIGFLKSLRDFKDRNGNDMAFGTLQDFEGEIDLVFFSKVYSECRDLLNLDEIVALKGSIDPENERNPEKISLKVSSIANLALLSRNAARKAQAGEKPPEPPAEKPKTVKNEELHVRLKEGAAGDSLYLLRDYLAANTGPCLLYIHVPVSGGEKTIRAAAGVASPAYSNVIEEIKKYKYTAEVWRN
ncbi:MAG: DNA polymerase III subunit alpha [Treponema sp.]|jgi:DNA polymerase-3 subunit alpha|nr:DNA polymerase III subunit alpha [Treponema sp.]